MIFFILFTLPFIELNQTQSQGERVLCESRWSKWWWEAPRACWAPSSAGWLPCSLRGTSSPKTSSAGSSPCKTSWAQWMPLCECSRTRTTSRSIHLIKTGETSWVVLRLRDCIHRFTLNQSHGGWRGRAKGDRPVAFNFTHSFIVLVQGGPHRVKSYAQPFSPAGAKLCGLHLNYFLYYLA